MEESKNTKIIEITNELIINMIHEVRGQKVMLDFELAELYGYETKRLNEQIKRNIERFPEEFMFQLTSVEVNNLSRSQNATAMSITQTKGMHGGRVTLPYAFTEQGVYMLMTVLKGEIAVKQSIALVKAFKAMKDYISNNEGLVTLHDILEISKQTNENTQNIKELKDDLKRQSEQLGIVMDNFVDPNKYKHIVIFNGQKIEAWLAFQNIYKQAKKSIIVIDDYIDINTLNLLKVCEKDIDVTIYSDNVARNKLSDEQLQIFINETGLIVTIKPTNHLIHDRYIFIDLGLSNEKGYHCGSSIKDSGSSLITIMEFENTDMYKVLLSKL